MRIGILTGGGDAPGLNAAIRAVVKAAANQRIETIGIEDGFRGLIEPNRWRCLTPAAVTGHSSSRRNHTGHHEPGKPAVLYQSRRPHQGLLRRVREDASRAVARCAHCHWR